MTDKPAAAPLDFEKADYVAPPALTCLVCKLAIGSEYYDVNGHPVCASCLAKVDSRQKGDWTKALLLGLGAAVAGSLVWFGVEKAFKIDVGIIAIGIGWLVGKGVRRGAGSDSSLGFPIAAVLLTYLSIAGAAALSVVDALGERWHAINPPALAEFAIESPVKNAGPIGLFIIAIGLYEAWKLARRPALRISGPFPVSRGAVG